jgi:hypothetical protein
MPWRDSNRMSSTPEADAMKHDDFFVKEKLVQTTNVIPNIGF